MKKFNLNGITFCVRNKIRYCTINQCGIQATYPLNKHDTVLPVKAVMMDLDGTTVKSEEFWIYLIEKTVRELTGNDAFRLTNDDIPYVSGFSTAEHLSYCLQKYSLPYSLEEADALYHKIAELELDEIMQGRGNVEAFKPRAGLKKFLLTLKENGIKVGLATSGLDYKAIPEITSTFKVLDMGDPTEFYDAIITGGRRKISGQYGTLGECAAKPHPWIYNELALGLNVKPGEAVVIEDSSAGLLSGRLAGFDVIGFSDGNIEQSGLTDECYRVADNFEQITAILQLRKG